jgi:hypothetical protein
MQAATTRVVDIRSRGGARFIYGYILKPGWAASQMSSSDQLNHLLYLQETVKIECDGLLSTEPIDQARFNRLTVQHMGLCTKALALMNKQDIESVDDILKGLECMSTRSALNALNRTGESVVYKTPYATTAFNALKKNKDDETVEDILESLQACITSRPDNTVGYNM